MLGGCVLEEEEDGYRMGCLGGDGGSWWEEE